ncbi:MULTISPECIES: 3-hydroxyacyl-ACP dehydratase FabZ family protein [Paenibacillus]|uniref:3-hydroxyacyl-ACP dehydratase FabZ family protein n=1 Tax=Paenibacillus TaxID=44249 RepID=UPI0015C83EFF|nr:FabA-like domain protein [Paenibacillus campinasensis]
MRSIFTPGHILPGPKPWILVDRVLDTVSVAQISTCKLISASDYFLQGHFQHYSVYPGVLLIEGIRQSLYLWLSRRTPDPHAIELRDMQVRFLTPAVPGDVIRYDITVQGSSEKGSFGRISATGTVDAKVVLTFQAACNLGEIKAENLSG